MFDTAVVSLVIEKHENVPVRTLVVKTIATPVNSHHTVTVNNNCNNTVISVKEADIFITLLYSFMFLLSLANAFSIYKQSLASVSVQTGAELTLNFLL